MALSGSPTSCAFTIRLYPILGLPMRLLPRCLLRICYHHVYYIFPSNKYYHFLKFIQMSNQSDSPHLSIIHSIERKNVDHITANIKILIHESPSGVVGLASDKRVASWPDAVLARTSSTFLHFAGFNIFITNHSLHQIHPIYIS